MKKIVFWSILLTSLIFRLIAIRSNLSFWNDEEQVAIMSRSILMFGKPITPFGTGGGIYQLALYYITALSFRLFSISEFSARIPSIIGGTLLVGMGYLITRQFLDQKRALVVAILLGFSQIQLAWSTQLRPYIWLEIFTLLTVFFLWRYLKSPWKNIEINLGYAILISIASCLFHGTGLINLGLVGLVVLYNALKHKQYLFLLVLPTFCLFGIFVVYGSLGGGWEFVRNILFRYYFSTLHYRIFLTHNYLWLMLGTAAGFIFLFRRNSELACLLGGSALFIFILAIFKISPNYVRYSLPAFPLMYILFAEGVVSVVDLITRKEYVKWTIIVLIFYLLSQTGKLIFWPKHYYSINADVRENPIVDYKLAFARIKNLLTGRHDTVVMDAWNDRVPWYLPDQKYIFLIKDGAGRTDPVFGEKMLGTVKEFEAEKKLYKTGVVIVEDWQSQTPEGLKEHIRKNLKFEFTVQDLPYNENDHWGISVYSWGI